MPECDVTDVREGRPLRILIGHLGEPDANSGAAGTNLAVATALRDAGHEVVELWQADTVRSIRHHALYYAAEAPARIRETVAAHLAKGDFDIVDFSQPHGYLAARHVREHHPDTRYVHFSHGFEGMVTKTIRQFGTRFPMEQPQRSLMRRIGSSLLDWKLTKHQRWIARWADGHIVSASPCAAYLHQALGVPSAHIATIPQAASPMFQESPHRGRSRQGGLLHVAQFSWFKAPMVAAAVFRGVAATSDARLCWICHSQHHDQVRQLLGPAADRVELRGWVDQDELASRMRQFSVFLFPSFFEGYGKAFVEAMAAGMAVVATRVGGMVDAIEHGVNGLIHDIGDVEGMTRSCIDLLQNQACAASIGLHAQIGAGSRTWAEHALERARFYRHLLRHTPATSLEIQR